MFEVEKAACAWKRRLMDLSMNFQTRKQEQVENVDVENHRAPATPANMGLLVAHLDAAYNLARWLLRNMADAEDAVQEAYLRAFRSFEGFQGGEGRAWLLAIVRNSCYDRLRRIPRNTDMFDERMHF